MRVNGRASCGMISSVSVTFRRFSKRAFTRSNQLINAVGAISGARTATFYRRGDAAAVKFEFVDNLRNGVQKLVAELDSAGISVEILSGDTQAAVADVAD